MNYSHSSLEEHTAHSQIRIRHPSAAEEADYVDHLVSRLAFYREHDYNVTLPQHPIIESIILETSEARRIELRRELLRIFDSELYDAGAYAKGRRRLEEDFETIQQALCRCRKFRDAWNFLLLPTYSVILTQYGTGGSYDVRTGRIILRTSAQGTFKRAHPSHTVVHEMVHIGIEEGIVQRLQLTHAEKERLVDLICSVGLGDVLVGYGVSPRGDARINPYVTPEAFHDLPSVIGRYVHDFPRYRQAA